MTVSWAIELDAEPAERVRADLLVALHFEDERPLRGAAARIDWRLCGHLSAVAQRGALRGVADEVVLVPTGSRLRAPRALLLGLGPREGFQVKALRAAARLAISRAAALRAGVVALALPPEAESGIPAERAATAAVIGAGEALQERPFPLRLRLALEPAALPRARQALAELVARIEMEGVSAHLAAPETTARPALPANPAGTSHHLEEDGVVVARRAPALGRGPLPKPPSVP